MFAKLPDFAILGIQPENRFCKIWKIKIVIHVKSQQNKLINVKQRQLTVNSKSLEKIKHTTRVFR